MVFGGLIRHLGSATLNGYSLVVTTDLPNIKLGDSIAINGVCLTVVKIGTNLLWFDLSEETVNITSYQYFKTDIMVNIDLPLEYDSLVDGHVLKGHVHETGYITNIIPLKHSTDIWIKVPTYTNLKQKDSVAVDGISLTIAEIKDDRFRVAIIPYTLSNTNLGTRKVGDYVNIEYNSITNSISEYNLISENSGNGDEEYMCRAIDLSELGRNTAPPNPWVGCVIVKDGEVIGEGYHVRPGEPHAEVNAINSVPDSKFIAGSDIYVTLEPCSHHGRTPPCVDLLIKYKPKRVIVGVVDSDSRVDGNGIQQLEKHGINVITGICEDKISESLRHYLYHREKELPFVTLKIGMSLDGSIQDSNGESQWITGSKSREHCHKLRSEHMAIMVGTNTILTDNPSLNVRHGNCINQPIRIILDRDGKIKYTPDINIFKGINIIFTSLPEELYRLKTGNNQTEDIYTAGINSTGLNIQEILNILRTIGIISLFVEGGPKLHSSFIRLKLFQELYIYRSTHMLGSDSYRWSNVFPSVSIKSPKILSVISTRTLGEDILEHYEIKNID